MFMSACVCVSFGSRPQKTLGLLLLEGIFSLPQKSNTGHHPTDQDFEDLTSSKVRLLNTHKHTQKHTLVHNDGASAKQFWFEKQNFSSYAVVYLSEPTFFNTFLSGRSLSA